ncbi:ABC transporter permease [Flavihumibacter fluvii]|uniref:ABC transporter permease n=1 Tax=Flavihumibacter fluvii TaxID=2838157 RepID=UPI001BDF675C|nr:ABC transporter permease subunit [Flavihumibacter fluvii]ULQ52519.1 ABC transporter permease [Flavihumibacter fluvii]
MWPILRIELYKVFKRPRTYISFVAIGAIVVLIQLAFYAEGNNYMAFGMQSLTQTFDIQGKVLNGYLICFIILQTLLIHVPLLIALVAGDQIAGEANMGTLRLLISKPVSRTKLLLAKFSASAFYTILLLVWMAFLALLVSILIFGTGDLMILKSEEVVVLNKADVLWRYFAAFGFAAIAMTTVAALSFLLSIFAENSIGPIVSTMSVIILFTILTTMDIPIFNAIKPYLFTTHMIGWKGFFDAPVSWAAVLQSAGVLVFHIFLFLGTSILVFNKKDILS